MKQQIFIIQEFLRLRAPYQLCSFRDRLKPRYATFNEMHHEDQKVYKAATTAIKLLIVGNDSDISEYIEQLNKYRA